jgi:hypothetical protein
MLSKGLGRHFAEDEKARLFQDAKHIADLLATVMDRRTQELKQGKQPLPPPRQNRSYAATCADARRGGRSLRVLPR